MQDRFERFVMPEPNSGCWLWTGSLNAFGYGKFRMGKSIAQAHRAAHELYIGPIPENMHVLHTCDNRCCVNPDHLWLGTHDDNMADRQSKGRQCKGEKVGRAKLSERDIVAIRNDNRLQREIAADYGIKSNQVSRIKSGKSWAHVVDNEHCV